VKKIRKGVEFAGRGSLTPFQKGNVLHDQSW
jgi:hypothetical protein